MFDKGMIKMVGDDTQWTEEGKDYLVPLDHLGRVDREWRRALPLFNGLPRRNSA